MTTIMASIQPKWCELIANGKKTIEVRKSVPKCGVPFKVYIYQTKSKDKLIEVMQDGDECYGNTINEELAPTLACTHGGEPVIALQANGIDRADTAGCNGCGWRENESYTLNTIDRHAVCYGIGNGQADNTDIHDKIGALNCMHDQQAVIYGARGNGEGNIVPTLTGDHQNRITDYTAVAVQKMWNGEDVAPTLTANNAGGNQRMPDKDNFNAVIQTAKPPRKYIIRRLTPTECCRLQGFPDCWADLTPYNPDDAEFWEQVRKTYAAINGKVYKPCKNLDAWYNKLHTDSAEYKMWGNGIALPNALYVLEGIATHNNFIAV